MNKFALLLMSILWAAAAFVSCSEASKLSGATTEPNGIANEESEITNSLSSDNTKLSSTAVVAPSSSAQTVSSSSTKASTSSSTNASISSSSAGNVQIDTLTVPIPEEKQKLCDSVLAAFEHTTTGQGSGISRTGFDFKSESELFYATQSCSVNIYEQESGVQILYGDGGRLENTSLYYQEKGVLLRLLNNTYGGDTCEQDFIEFEKNCRKESGVFKDYNDGEGCSLGKLELACVSVVDASSTRAMLQREANLYKKVCQGITVPGDQECSATCRIVDNEMACDTVCNLL